MTRASGLVLSLFLAGSISWAQFGSGLQGTVTDRSGAIIAGVTIRVTNIDTGVAREVSSSESGVYVVPSLNPGNYSIQALKDGFVAAKQDSLVLEPDLIRKVDFTLEVGNVHDVVNVSERPTILETETAHVVSTMNQATLTQMPVVNNSVFNLMALQPGVTGRSLSVDNVSGRSTATVNFAGARVDSNSYSIDGMSVNSISRGGAAEIAPNVESVEQVSVQLTDANSEDGRNQGAHVNIITKSGTNQFRGSAWDYFSSNDLDARNFFSKTVNPLVRNQFGFTFGGPVIKNRTFFFTSYEGIRQATSTPTTSTVETQAFAQWIIANRPNSIAATLMKDFPPAAYATTNLKDIGTPLSGVPACGGCAFANQYSTTPLPGIMEFGTASWNDPNHSTSDGYTLRVDHELKPGKDRIYGYYYQFAGVSKTPPLRDFERDNPEVGHDAHINETHIFSPTILNEFSAGMVRYIGTYTIPLNAWVSPISIGGGFSTANFQDTNPYPGGWFATEYMLKDSVSIVRGRHTIKTGVERRRADNNTKHTASYIPNYTFTNILTFANDDALSETRTVNPQTGQPTITYASQRITEYGAYVQDEWKLRKDLTVNLGLRWEYFGPYTDAKNRLSNFIYGPGSSLPQEIATGSAQSVAQSWNPNYANFAPRLGIAWDIGGKGKNVIRAGYGLGYDRLATVYPANYRNNPPLIGLITAGTQYGTTFTYGLGNPSAVASQYNPQGLGYPIDPAFAAGLNSQNGIIGEKVSLAAVSQNLPQSYTQNWFFGYQRTLPWRMVLEGNYLGSKGTHLVEIANINQFDGDLLNGGVIHGYNSNFSSINMANTNGTSTYHGLTVSARKVLSHGLTFQGAYTWSKAIDESEYEQGITYFQNVNNQNLDRSLASFNVPQRLSLNGFYNIPFLRTCGGWYCKAFGAWDLSAYAIFEKGLPLDVYTSATFPASGVAPSITTNGEWQGNGTPYARPNAPTTAVQTSGFTQAQFLTGIVPASAFSVPVLGTDGNLGRNVFQGPGFERVDMSLTKFIPIWERFQLRFRLEIDNTLNHTNLTPPTISSGSGGYGFDLSSASFGKITTAAISRQMQASLMLKF
jgi:hypothetical protein